jgi:hypothetical protein
MMPSTQTPVEGAVRQDITACCAVVRGTMIVFLPGGQRNDCGAGVFHAGTLLAIHGPAPNVSFAASKAIGIRPRA